MGKRDSRDQSRGRKQVTVVNSKGQESRFLRGMITHDLVQRGLDFDRAYAIASSVRDTVGGRERVSTAELAGLIREELVRYLGPDLPDHLTRGSRPAPAFSVLYHGDRHPFSRGLLARSIHAAGLELDHAYRLVRRLTEILQEEGRSELRSDELVRRVSELLRETEGAEAARRYLLVRRINRLPRPLVVYVGGATGTGKSTLSLELAPLLRIYRIGATDTIRQVLRIVFSEKVMPELHSSSFETISPFGFEASEPPLRLSETDSSDLLLQSYEEQSARVVVGVRAIVERAITENTSLIVEGVHLCPPLVPFKDLEGAIYQVPLVLATLDPEVHRSRFLARAGATGRHAERYLERFRAIRQIHDFVLHQAELHDVQTVDTSDGDPPVVETLRLVTEMLGSKLPEFYSSADGATDTPVPTLLLVVDGLADRPIRALGGRTPLQAAKTPTLDRLAREGQTGLADPVSPGVVPDTAAGSLALFGQSPVAMKRGPVEALGAGIELGPGDVALRGNFATLDDQGLVIDRRAGRIREGVGELAKALDRLPLTGGLADEIEVRVRNATEHRLAIVLRGERLSSAILGSDPGEGAAPGRPLIPRPLDPHDEAAVYTARALALFEQQARQVLGGHKLNKRRRREGLPVANAVITRGAGHLHRLIPLEEAGFPLRIACVAGDRTVLGLAGWLGARTIHSAEMTASLDSNLRLKFDEALAALASSDLVILHLKGADIAAHDQRPDLKVDFIERFDRELGRLVKKHDGPLRIAVGSDHSTLSESGQHAADPVPVLIWGDGIEPDAVEAFDESSAGGGRLQRFPLQMFLTRLYEPR